MTKKLTDKEILEGIVKKAIERGWDVYSLFYKGMIRNGIEIIALSYLNNNLYVHYIYHKKKDCKIVSLADLIADHSFMEALCGKEMVCAICGKSLDKQAKRIIKYNSLTGNPYCQHCDSPRWLFAFHRHQQRLIILPEDERLQYLKRFLEVK